MKELEELMRDLPCDVKVCIFDVKIYEINISDVGWH